MTNLTRTLKLGCVGTDVDGWARAAHRYLQDGLLDEFEQQKPVVRGTFGPAKRTLAKRCAKQAGLPQYGVVGEQLEEAMRDAGAFDQIADGRVDAYNASKIDPALVRARELLAYCRLFTGGYLYGGGHGVPLHTLTPARDLDCSSSTSLALWKHGLFLPNVAAVSGEFERWGEPGRGRYVTVHANDEHVWVEFSLPDVWCRFDTSPHGDGPRGPRVRTGRRGDSTFVHRHPKGL